MAEIRCSKCNKIAIFLGVGSKFDKGLLVICSVCQREEATNANFDDVKKQFNEVSNLFDSVFKGNAG